MAETIQTEGQGGRDFCLSNVSIESHVLPIKTNSCLPVEIETGGVLGPTGRDTSLIRQLLDKQLTESGGRRCSSGRGGHSRVVIVEADELGVRLGFTFAGVLLRVAHSHVGREL